MKVFRVLSSFVLAAFVTLSLNSCASAQQARMDTPGNLSAADIPAGRTLSGNYLAGRFAQRQQDWDAAQHYMNAVIAHDEGNTLLEQRAFLLSIGAMQYARARELAENLKAGNDNVDLALIYLSCDALARGDYAAALKSIERLPEDGFGQYTKPLLSAWAHAGRQEYAKALKLLRDKSDDSDPTYNIHAGLIQEMAQDAQAAEKHYRAAMENGLTMHTAVIVANFFRNAGKPHVAKTIYEGLGKVYPLNAFTSAPAQTDKAAPNITRASEGAAVALFELATLLYERRAYDSAQIYGSMVLLLDPKSPFATMMMGDIAALHGQYQKAIDSYDTVAENSPLYWLSRMRVAEVYEISDNVDRAVALLTDLSKKKNTRLQALVSLGDMHRRHEDFASALKAYDEALSGVETVAEEHWPIIYARGMALERLNNWERAEKDLLQALAFQPDNPMILNFIGYTWADKGVHLDKALDYIRRAVAMRPDDGYIVDSLGWALYKTGDYKEAVQWLERAVGIVPDDSTILDHLGDAYWQVGRSAEARFKWKRAHELSRDTGFRAVVERKLIRGIEPVPAQVAHKEAKL